MTSLLANVPRQVLLFALLAPVAPAQWSSLPKNPAQPVIAGNWFVAHDTGAGLAVFSAVAQSWQTLSPAGSTFLHYTDAVVVTQESPTQLRAWSAFSNRSVPQTVSSTFAYWNMNVSGLAHAVLFDPVPATNGVLRGYSAYTDTWTSQPVSQPSSIWTVMSSENAAVYHDGLSYHAFSAYTGQWATLTVPVASGNAILGPDFVAVDLQGTGGPRQYAAFSAQRGAWTLSPVYPAAGAGLVYSPAANVLAIKVETGTATSFHYAGFSPATGQWSTSPLTHTTASTQTAIAYENMVRVQDTDTNARFEVFGLGNGVWQSITGAGLTEESLHANFQVVKSVSASATTLHAASGLVGGGYVSTVVPTIFFAGVTQGPNCCIFGDGTNEWAYTAATNTFVGPVPAPFASGGSSGTATSVAGFMVTGSSASGTTAQAFSARWGDWVPGPAIAPSASWLTFASGSMLMAEQQLFPGYVFHVFDEHRNSWNAPISSPNPIVMARNCMIYTDGVGDRHGYSAQTGVWSTQSGVGTGTVSVTNIHDNLAWFTDANNLIWVFATPDRTQSWFQWPAAAQFVPYGGPAAGALPYAGVSSRGGPTEYALLYASLTLAPFPLVIPGFGGQLDLSPTGAIQLAGLGLYGAEGVLDAKFPFADLVPPGLQVWMQVVTVDLSTFAIAFPGRATGMTVF